MTTNPTTTQTDATAARTTARPQQTTPADFGGPQIVDTEQTDAGTLVWGDCEKPGKKLIGFGSDMDPEAMIKELRKRNHGHGAVRNLPVFEM